MANAIRGNEENESGWTQPDPIKPEITNREITIKIGDYVDYDCTTSDATYTSEATKNGYGVQTFNASSYNYGWRVLGVDKNTKQLLLISEDLVPLTGGGDSGNRTGQYYYLSGQNGYVNGIEELNNICSIYGTGIGATSARVVTVDDIDRITGYNPNNIGKKDPNKTGSGTKCYSGKIDEYGNSVKYTLLSTGVKYEPTNNVASRTNTDCKQFTYYDEVSKTWKNLTVNKSVTLKNNSYYYYPTTLTDRDDKTATVGIGVNTTEYKMLFTNSSTGADTANSGKIDNFYYWLGSSFVSTNDGDVRFGLRRVYLGNIYSNVLYSSKGTTNSLLFRC